MSLPIWLVGDICWCAGGAFTNYFQIPKITAFIREATLCGFVDPFCLRVPRVYVRHAGSQIWQTWVAEMGEAAENWAEGRTDWGWGATGGWTVSSKLKKAFEGAPAIYGDGCLGIELLQFLFAVADSMKEIWDHPSYAGRRNHVLYSPPNRLWPCSFWWGGVGARSLAERGKFTQSSSFVTHSAIFSGNAWGKKLITSNYLDGSSYQL